MKKILLFTCFFSLYMSTVAFGQGTRYGFKLGLNASQISGLEFNVVNVAGDTPIAPFGTAEESRIGFMAAFFAEFPISDKLSFQPEFGFSTQGNKFEGVRYDYLQIPLALRINVDKLFFNIGPQAGIKISFYEQSENYESIEFAGFGGIGYHFNENIFIEARYTYGFTEVFSDDAFINLPSLGNPEDGIAPNRDNFLSDLSGTNSYFTFSIGYKL